MMTPPTGARTPLSFSTIRRDLWFSVALSTLLGLFAHRFWPLAWSWRTEGWLILLTIGVLLDLMTQTVPWILIGSTWGWGIVTHWIATPNPHPLWNGIWPLGVVAVSIALSQWNAWPLGGGDMKWLVAMAYGMSPWGVWLWWTMASILAAGTGRLVARRWIPPDAPWPFVPWAVGVLLCGWLLIH